MKGSFPSRVVCRIWICRTHLTGGWQTQGKRESCPWPRKKHPKDCYTHASPGRLRCLVKLVQIRSKLLQKRSPNRDAVASDLWADFFGQRSASSICISSVFKRPFLSSRLYLCSYSISQSFFVGNTEILLEILTQSISEQRARFGHYPHP